MAGAGSRDGTDGMLEAGYPSITSRGISKWIDSGTSVRGNGYPFKRYPAAGRPNGTGGDPLNGLDKKENGIDVHKGSGQLPTRSSRAVLGRNIKSDGESGSAKGRSCIYSILISVVVCCFLAVALLQGSVMMLWKQTDLSLNLRNVKPTDVGGRLGGPESYSLEYKLRFDPWKLKERVLQQKHSAGKMRMFEQSFLRPPYIALVCANLYRTPESLYLVTLAKGFQALGYKLQLFTFEGGPMQGIWQEQGIGVERLQLNPNEGLYVDWSKFEGVILSSLDARQAFGSFLQEPFKNVVVIWVILEDTLGKRLSLYERSGLNHLIFEWKQAFARANVVVFPDYTLPMMHTLLDTGNFLVISGSPKDAWDVKSYVKSHSRDELRQALGLKLEDVVLTVVGSPFTYKGVWREHAMIMQSVFPIFNKMTQVNKKEGPALKLLFVGSNPASSYGHVVQVMARHLGLKDGSVSYFSDDNMDVNGLLWVADIVVYSSLRDEQEFPCVLLRAVSLDRFILAPNITIVQNFLMDGFGSLFYPAGDFGALTEKVMLSISNYNMLDRGVNLTRFSHATQLLVRNALEGYADLLESILAFPSDTMLPKPMSEIPGALTQDWQWELLAGIDELKSEDIFLTDGKVLPGMVFTLERLLNSTNNRSRPFQADMDYDMLTQDDWQEEKATRLADDLERKEEEQIEERHELLRGSWEDIYKVVKKMERLKTELHERDDGELERTGQPLCIYEPYFGMGASIFVHQNDPFYRGISMISKQKRPGYDDIDAASRLPLLNDSYYQEVLCEYGAFFSIANRIDRVHKNSWIGFQPWRASDRKVALSTEADKSLRDAIKSAKHGDALYFWAQIPENDNFEHQKSIHQDFWSFCDMVNNNNCRSVFLDVFKQMYGLPPSWTSLPPMPVDGGKWSALHCWAMPTSSFLEFVMFARMFVDALDSQHYTEHHDRRNCSLGISESEVEHCYCRLLELLVDVWAYHSARIMIYVDPNTGAMREQHSLDGRQGHMWVKYFDYGTLKSMDEELAEEVDDELHKQSSKRWLWPQTGEVYWQGMFERERREQHNLKMEKRRKNRERLERIRSRYRQKPLAGG